MHSCIREPRGWVHGHAIVERRITLPPDDLLYAVVVKRREEGHLVKVSSHAVYGTPEQIAAALAASSVSNTISTYGVERN
jgi:hypothetical protein